MSSDRSRGFDDLGQSFKAVVMQQGRVILDRDFNALQEIVNARTAADALDEIGPCGTPDNGFEISLPAMVPANYSAPSEWDFLISPGTMYVGGERVVLRAPLPGGHGFLLNALGQPSWSYFNQPDWLTLADSPALGGASQSTLGHEYVLLNVFEQEVGAIEDPELLDIALGGPDTTQRIRLMWRVIRLPVKATACPAALLEVGATWQKHGFLFDPPTMRRLPQVLCQVSFAAAPTVSNPCDTAVQGGYLGAENQLIRLQIAEPAMTGGVRQERLLWGYDNASFLYGAKVKSDKVTLVLDRAPVDAYHNPKTKQVVEVLRSAVSLAADPDGTDPTALVGYVAEARGHLAVVSSYSAGDNSVVLDSPLPPAFLSDQTPLYLRVWQGLQNIDPGSTQPISLTDSTDQSTQGVQVAISVPPTAVKGAELPVGAFWMIAVRPSTPQQVYPQRFFDGPQPPDGPRQWICPLAVILWKSVSSFSSPTFSAPAHSLPAHSAPAQSVPTHSAPAQSVPAHSQPIRRPLLTTLTTAFSAAHSSNISDSANAAVIVDCRNRFLNLVDLTNRPCAGQVMVTGVFASDGQQFDVIVDNGDGIRGDVLAQGLQLLLDQQNIDPLSVTPGSCFGTLEIPFTILEQTNIATISLILEANATVDSRGAITWIPGPHAQRYLNGNQMFQSPQVQFINDWSELSSTGAPGATWSYDGGRAQVTVPTQPVAPPGFDYYAVSRDVLSDGPVALRMSVTPPSPLGGNVTYQGSGVGVLFNYSSQLLNQDCYTFTMSSVALNGLSGPINVSIYLMHLQNGDTVGNEFLVVDGTLSFAPAVIDFDIRPSDGGLLAFTATAHSADGKNSKQFSVGGTATWVPRSLVAGSRVALFTDWSGTATFTDLVIDYSTGGRLVLLPLRRLFRLTLKRDFLKVVGGTDEQGGCGLAGDFSAWLWVLPSRPAQLVRVPLLISHPAFSEPSSSRPELF